MLNKVLHFIEKHEMIKKGDKVIVGISGGADSVCLLFVLQELAKVLDFSLIAIHVEHGIRGEASIADADFVKRLSNGQNIPFEMYTFEVEKIADKEKLSLEEAGRKVRYEAFHHAQEKWKADKIAVAHNRDDNSETALMNYFRGSGLKGLCGIPPVRGNIIRPLLDCTRAEIESFLKIRGIVWRTDETNLCACYTRNKIRLHILPYVQKELNTMASAHIAESTEQLREIEVYLEKEAGKLLDRCAKAEGDTWQIESSIFLEAENVIQAFVLKEILTRISGSSKDIGRKHIEAVRELLTKQTGSAVHLPYGIHVKKSYGILSFEHCKKEPEEELCYEFSKDEAGEIQIGENRLAYFARERKGEEIFSDNAYTKCFNYDIIKSNLRIRTRKDGDYFFLHNSGGKKKLKDFFMDEKIPRQDRDRILLLAEGSHILWIIGYRISAKYKIKEDTNYILEVTYSGGKIHDR